MSEQIVQYDGCKYSCYSKDVKTRSGKDSFRVFCRRIDSKCVVGAPAPKVELPKPTVPIMSKEGLVVLTNPLVEAAKAIPPNLFLLAQWNNQIQNPGGHYNIHTKANNDKVSIATYQTIRGKAMYLIAHPTLTNYLNLYAANKDLVELHLLRHSVHGSQVTLPPLSIFDFNAFQLLMETPMTTLDNKSFQQQLVAVRADKMLYDTEKYCALMEYYIKAGYQLSEGANRDFLKLCGYTEGKTVSLKSSESPFQKGDLVASSEPGVPTEGEVWLVEKREDTGWHIKLRGGKWWPAFYFVKVENPI